MREAEGSGVMKSSTMIGGAGAHARHPSDFYETPYQATRALIEQLSIPEEMTIWEPACGNGAISLVLESHGYEVISSDIRGDPSHDFLKDDLERGVHWIITNPPFNLADDFIRRAWEAKVPFAFLLKATFWNTAAHGRLYKSCPPTGIYPLTWRPAMAPNRGKSPTMDFMWCVWRYRSEFKPMGKPSWK